MIVSEDNFETPVKTYTSNSKSKKEKRLFFLHSNEMKVTEKKSLEKLDNFST